MRRTVATVLSGTTVGQFRESNRLIDIVVRQPVEERSTMSVLANTNVATPAGRPVPLSQLARIEFVWEPGVVWREGREWAIMVQADVVEGIQGPTVSAQVGDKLAALRAGLPAGYRITLEGAAADSSEAEACLLYTSPSPRDGLLSRMPSSA